jgi:ParB/Sulfiredoxin domain
MSDAGVRDTSKYQLMPEMNPAEFEALKADIAQRGVVVPIDIDENGEILDGHHRYRAWAELHRNEPPSTIVRAGLSEQEKRAFARKNNILRRHLTREQIRRLIAEQLRDSPEWADNRIAEELGVDHKTVRAVRDDLEATWEIPKLDQLVGKDGKARRRRKAKPTTLKQAADGSYQAALDDDIDDDDDDLVVDRRKRRRSDDDAWNDPVRQAKFHHAVDLTTMGADANSEKVVKLMQQASACTFTTPNHDPLAGRSDEEKLEWHLFILFLSFDRAAGRAGGEPQRVAEHVEYVLQRPFQNVVKWLGPEGDKFRRYSLGSRPIPDQFKADWVTFLASHRHRELADVIKELATLQERFEQDLTRRRRT